MTLLNWIFFLLVAVLGLLLVVVVGVVMLLWKLRRQQWPQQEQAYQTTASKVFQFPVETGVGVPKLGLIDDDIDRDELLWAFESGANDTEEAEELIRRDRHNRGK